MKRRGKLFDNIIAFDNLAAAYKKAARGRRFGRPVLRFHDRLEENLTQLHNELAWGEYSPGAYRTFTIYEPKERVIYAAPFRDRVVHHAIMNILEPIWDGLFISDSYACRKGKGTHAAADRLTGMLRSAYASWEHVYCLKADIAGFFPNINHHVLMAIIRRKIKCRRTLDLLDRIVFACGDRNDPYSHNLPIGNLISQWGANLYLNELDIYAKHQLKAHYYLRYMDDFIVLHDNRRELWGILDEIESYLAENLKLKLNRKTSIFPAWRGIDFVGYRIWPNYRLLRKSSSKRMVRRLKWMQGKFSRGRIGLEAIRQRINSWLAHCRHCNSWMVRRRVMRGAVFTRDRSAQGCKLPARQLLCVGVYFPEETGTGQGSAPTLPEPSAGAGTPTGGPQGFTRLCPDAVVQHVETVAGGLPTDKDNHESTGTVFRRQEQTGKENN